MRFMCFFQHVFRKITICWHGWYNIISSIITLDFDFLLGLDLDMGLDKIQIYCSKALRQLHEEEKKESGIRERQTG